MLSPKHKVWLNSCVIHGTEHLDKVNKSWYVTEREIDIVPSLKNLLDQKTQKSWWLVYHGFILNYADYINDSGDNVIKEAYVYINLYWHEQINMRKYA